MKWRNRRGYILAALSAHVVSMLTPFARHVISRIRRLKRAKAFGAIEIF